MAVSICSWHFQNNERPGFLFSSFIGLIWDRANIMVGFKMRSDNIGHIGESEFKRICLAGNMTPNKSDIDRTGWDFTIEFPFDADVSLAIFHEAPIDCKVQVKATENQNKTGDYFAVDSLRRLITSKDACFIVFIKIDESSIAKKLYLIHVDEEFSKIYLPKVYKRKRAGNNSKIYVSFESRVEVEKPHSSSLYKKLKEFIGGNIGEYVAKKQNYLKDIGINEERNSRRLTFNPKSEKRFYVPIGEKSVSYGELVSQEIKVRFEEEYIASQKIIVGSNIDAPGFFDKEIGSIGVYIGYEMISSPISADIACSLWNEILHVNEVFNFSGENISFGFNQLSGLAGYDIEPGFFKDRMSLSRLRSLLIVRQMIGNGMNMKPYSIHCISKSGRYFNFFPLCMHSTVEYYYGKDYCVEMLDKLRGIADIFGCFTEIEASVSDLLTQSLEIYYGLELNLGTALSFKLSLMNELKENQEYVFLTARFICVGDLIFGYCYSVLPKVICPDNDRKNGNVIFSSEYEIKGRMVFRKKTNKVNHFRSMMDGVALEYPDDCIVITDTEAYKQLNEFL